MHKHQVMASNLQVRLGLLFFSMILLHLELASVPAFSNLSNCIMGILYGLSMAISLMDLEKIWV